MTDRQAQLLRALHDEHADAVWRYVVRLTGDAGRAQYVVQETLLRAWRKPEVLDQSERSARAWLFTVARNLVFDHHGSAASRREIATDEPPETATSDNTDAVLDSWLVAEALARLSAEHREVIVQCYYRGTSTAEAADRIGIAPGTVKSRLHYGLRALRLVLQEMGVTA
jgi:RNA polymerase sigma-70 factor (ECF subfamily)